MDPVYLDHNATTPIDPRVADAIAPFLTRHSKGFGNPSSAHALGRQAAFALDKARTQVATMIGAQPSEIVFTGCGSESNNLALIGYAKTKLRAGKTFGAVTTTIEHPAVLAPLASLEDDYGERVRIQYAPVDDACRLDVDAFAAAMAGQDLASVMLANNETGTIQPIAEVSNIVQEHGACLHVDAAQAAGKIAIDVDDLGVDLLTVVGHKMGAPKGVSALYVRTGTPLVPLIFGAGHESGRRAGTENVILAVALGEACAISTDRLSCMVDVANLRDIFEAQLREALGDRLQLNGDRTHRLPNTLHVSVLGARASDILGAVTAVAASTGSACHEDGVTLSPVLNAMRVTEERGAGAFRFSLGPETTREEIDIATRALLERLLPV